MKNISDSKNIFEEFDALQQKYLFNQQETNKVYDEMKKEISESKKRIELTYQEKIEQSKKDNQKLKQEISNYKKLIEEYSTFNIKIIGSIISKLISLVECRDFSYQEATHETFKYESTVFGSESFKTTNYINLIVINSQRSNYYHDYDENSNEINKLVKNKQAILLNESSYDYNKAITFYSMQNGILKCLIDFNNFPYVKDFIDVVIQFRYSNSEKSITEKQLLELMKRFIIDKKDLIEENYKKIVLEKQEQLQQQLMAEQEKRNLEMEQIELESLLKKGVPSKYHNNLIDRLIEVSDGTPEFDTKMHQFGIIYDTDQHIAKFSFDKPILSSENIFISKIKIEANIEDYFDTSDPDPHFHGFTNVYLVDDGLVGFVEISNSEQFFISDVSLPWEYGLYKIEKIGDKYLRVLFLPNKGEYKHIATNAYSWIIESIFDKDTINNQSEEPLSYKVEWNYEEEAEKMKCYLEEIELLSNMNEKQLKLYKRQQRV